MRNLTKTIAVVTLMAPVAAHPLGIGDIELHSALNQTLNAEISLYLAEGENLGDIQVSLAPPGKFKEVGIPRSYFLSQIKFQPIVKPDGSVVIQLSSAGVVKEPYLDFLLQVSWPNGSLYREFSVLMDPPVTYQQPVTAALSVPEAERPLTPGSVSGIGSTTPVPERSPRARFQNLQAEGQYGPTRRNDTLWEIAQKVKTHDVSVEQMMIALYEANPQAFYNENINTLMVGKTLKVPEKDIVLRLSRKEARAEFSRQTNIWKGNVAAARHDEPVTVTEEDASHLKLVAPGEGDVGEQELVAAKQVDIDEAAIGELAAEEAVETELGQENREIKSRLEKLEQQLIAMQKMLALKDEQLAALQREKAKAVPAIEPETAVPPEPVEQPAERTTEAVKPVEQPIKPIEQPVKPVPEVKPGPAVKPVVTTGPDNTAYYMTIGGVGFSVLGLLGWLWWRQRRLEEEDSTESMFAASSEIILPETDQELSIPVVDEKAYDADTVGESSFLSEFIPSDFDAFDTEHAEVDPISEADVYLAYGRYQQAEDLMRQAIEENPERDECKLKLLEIFFANEDKASFEKYAKQLAESGKKDEVVFWAKVAEMGSEFIPESALFDETATADFDSGRASQAADMEEPEKQQDSAQEVKAASMDVAESEMDFDLPELDAEKEQTDAAESDVEAVDMETENFDFEPHDDNDEAPIRLESVETLDDRSEYDTSASEQAFSENPFEEGVDNDQRLESIDFDIDLEEPADSIQLDSSSEQLDTEASDEFDFTRNESSGPGLSKDLSGLDDFSFDFDLDSSLTIDDETTDDEDAAINLTEMDEFETKIDLAKAYIDMGDPDAARNLVGEVLENGSDDQKHKAQILLNTLQ